MPQDDTLPPAEPHPGTLAPKEFAERFQCSAHMLWCLAASILGNRTHAEDVLQEAALTGLQKLQQFRSGTNFDAWMGQIVRFTALNQLRKLKRSPQPLSQADSAPGEPAAPEPAATGKAVEMSGKAARLSEPEAFDDRVLNALGQLKENARSCLLLKTVMEMEYREIASVLDIAEGTAMSHVHRAREKLRGILGDDFFDPGLATRRVS